MSESTLNPFGALLSIDLDALCDNWRSLRARLSAAECAAVVKADAYGLGVKRHQELTPWRHQELTPYAG